MKSEKDPFTYSWLDSKQKAQIIQKSMCTCAEE